MSTKIFCPVDGSVMTNIGDQGIVDYDGNWDAQASRYECSNKELCNHTIFFIDSDCIVEAGSPAWTAAEQAITKSMSEAQWDVKAGTVCLRSPLLSDDFKYQAPIKSLDDLRHELAQRAVEAFKDEIDENPDNHNYENVEYEYIHAIEDVDDVLPDFEPKLKEMGWLDEK